MYNLSSFIDRKMAPQSIAHHAHAWTADGDKFSCYPWLVCHDINSAMHCLLRLVYYQCHVGPTVELITLLCCDWSFHVPDGYVTGSGGMSCCNQTVFRFCLDNPNQLIIRGIANKNDISLVPTPRALRVRNSLVSEVEFLGLIPQNSGRSMRLWDH